MAYSIQHLLVIVFYMAVGLAALTNLYGPFGALSQIILRLMVFGTLAMAAYGIWACAGELRAFYAGVVIWGTLYFLLHVVFETATFNLGTGNLLRALSIPFTPDFSGRGEYAQISTARFRSEFVGVGQWWLSTLFGLVGGWVTVYFYRKRQRMLSVHRGESIAKH